MIDTKKIIEAAERNLQGTDMYVVGCTCTPGNDGGREPALQCQENDVHLSH